VDVRRLVNKLLNRLESNLTAPAADTANLIDFFEGLPLTNIGESTRIVLDALYELNHVGSDLTPAQRLAHLKSYQPAVDFISEALQPYYVEHPLPLPEKNWEAVSLNQQLVYEMAKGYLKLLTDNPDDKHDVDIQLIQATAIHGALQQLGRILIDSYLVYTSTPPKLWSKLHDLFQLAERLEGDTDDPTVRQRLQAAIDSYTCFNLLASADPYGLEQKDILHLADRLAMPATKIRPSTPHPDHDHSGMFVVRLDQDSHPNRASVSRNPLATNSRLLDTSRLKDLLAPDNSQGDRYAGHDRYTAQGWTPGALTHLQHRWKIHARRRFTRSQAADTITITLGIDATHHFIEPGIREQQAPSRGVLRDTPQAVFTDRPARTTTLSGNRNTGHQGLFGLGDQIKTPDYLEYDEPDILDILGAAKPPPPVRQTLHTCTILDQSANGARLLWKANRAANFRVGEVVGMFVRDNQSSYRTTGIAVIRWLRSVNGSALMFGIRFLAPTATAVALRVYQEPDRYSDYVKGLFLPEVKALKQPASLLVPTLVADNGKSIILNHNGDEKPISRIGSIFATRVFDQIAFRPATPRQ
jgi:hypothetical protein